MRLNKEEEDIIINAKKTIINARALNLIDFGNVGCALITPKGNIFCGICIDFYCGIGSCAEYQAIGSMLTNGEKEIKSIVAIHYDEKTKRYNIIPPCGKCREMIHQLNKKNLNTEIIISSSRKVKLKELLPYAWNRTLKTK